MEKELEEWQKLHKFYLYTRYRTKDLANYLDVTQRTIQRWLTGKTSPSKQQLEQIKRYLSEESSKELPEETP